MIPKCFCFMSFFRQRVHDYRIFEAKLWKLLSNRLLIPLNQSLNYLSLELIYTPLELF